MGSFSEDVGEFVAACGTLKAELLKELPSLVWCIFFIGVGIVVGGIAVSVA